MKSRPELPKPGTWIAGKYRVESLLAAGGMGAVFAATHGLTGRAFAIKWLLPELTAHQTLVQRFLREAQIGAQIQHPNIVKVYDVGQDGDSFYMVMELLRGESLADRLDRVRRLGLAEACEILLPVINALAALHGAGVIHRDLKPENIFLSRSDSGELIPKLIDFGVSKVLSPLGSIPPDATCAEVIVGTPNYMAPEQMRQQAVDERTDIYALGIVLYELLTGSVPFEATNYPDLVLRVMSTRPKPVSELVPSLPAALSVVVATAMAREPEDRFATAAAFGRALAQLAATIESTAASSHVVLSDADRRTRRERRSTGTPLATEWLVPAQRRAAYPAAVRLPLVAALFMVVGGGFAHWTRSYVDESPVSAARAVDSSDIGNIAQPADAMRAQELLTANNMPNEAEAVAAGERVPAVTATPSDSARAMSKPLRKSSLDKRRLPRIRLDDF